MEGLFMHPVTAPWDGWCTLDILVRDSSACHERRGQATTDKDVHRTVGDISACFTTRPKLLMQLVLMLQKQAQRSAGRV